jgi:methyl-accepting chemotaxis protein
MRFRLGAGKSAKEQSERRRDLEATIAALDRSQAVIEFDLAGIVLFANDNFLSVMGYAREEVVGQHHRLFMDPHEASSDQYQVFWKRLNAGEFIRGEFKRLAKDGRQVWIQASYNPVTGADGRPIKVIKYASDVTAAKMRAVEDAGQIAAIGRSQAVIAFDLEGIVLSANENFLDAMGYSAEEVVGRHHRQFMPAGEADRPAYASFWKRLAAGEFVSGEFKRIGKNGREVWIQASYNPILDPSGRPFKIVKYASDVTATKLKAVDFAGQIAAISASQAVIEFDLNGVILAANANFLTAMGYTSEEVVGRPHTTFVDPGYARSAAYTEFWAALNRGECLTGEFRRLGKGGREVWIQASYTPILDLNGRPFKVVKFASDITAEVAQRQKVRQLSLVADGTDNSVVITDAQRRIEYVNPGFERLTGYSAAEAMGKSPGELLQGAHTDPDTVRRIRARLNSGEAFYEEILNYDRSGSPYWISLAINPVRDAQGRIERFISVQANVTQTKQKALEYTVKLETIGRSNALAEWR